LSACQVFLLICSVLAAKPVDIQSWAFMNRRVYFWIGIVLLTALALALVESAQTLPRFFRPRGSSSDDPKATSTAHTAAREQPCVVWTFEPPERGAIVSSPLVTGRHIYVAIIHDAGLSTHGALYCLDRQTGKRLWHFDDDGQMLHMFSSPCLANGLLYLGEGMHENFHCNLYCLDAASGRKRWAYPTDGHIESSPAVADGKVFFGAGDEGLYCLDAATGEKLWQYTGPIHIDTSPAVSGRRVYGGSGESRSHKATEIFCLDADKGRVIWRQPTDLPVWGSPAVAENTVFYGLGNGRLLSPPCPARQAGGCALVCGQPGRPRALALPDL
jgi:PQQ-like domain